MSAVSSLTVYGFEENTNVDDYIVIIEDSINVAISRNFKMNDMNLQSVFDIFLTQMNESKDWSEIVIEIEIELLGSYSAKGILKMKRGQSITKWECLMQNINQIVSAVCELIHQLIQKERRLKGLKNEMY
ncbi:MAG: hypothetical protein OXE77_06580 [Flavobacteriaceae bacterium]|nr:hypothetical protein [Flavobacteriaceae bacterium]MCY4268466.1 hypothetical protein [Flavobacteriaceae bacterium]MCY4299068.1 hypothetical protein [Flavobacteriaceae bacterium]